VTDGAPAAVAPSPAPGSVMSDNANMLPPPPLFVPRSNLLIVWGAVVERGYAGQGWLTLRQRFLELSDGLASAAGGAVVGAPWHGKRARRASERRSTPSSIMARTISPAMPPPEVATQAMISRSMGFDTGADPVLCS
jgi:hypothetical protein